MIEVRVTARGAERWVRGHPWIYRSDVRDVTGAGPGVVVRVIGAKEKLLGHALFSDQSQIVLRMVSRGEVAVDAAFWGLSVLGTACRSPMETLASNAQVPDYVPRLAIEHLAMTRAPIDRYPRHWRATIIASSPE